MPASVGVCIAAQTELLRSLYMTTQLERNVYTAIKLRQNVADTHYYDILRVNAVQFFLLDHV